MGLDLTIRVQSDFRTDEFGRDIWTVTQIANLRRCHNILEQLSNRLESGFSNCATLILWWNIPRHTERYARRINRANRTL